MSVGVRGTDVFEAIADRTFVRGDTAAGGAADDDVDDDCCCNLRNSTSAARASS
jgi:hypothetical protein